MHRMSWLWITVFPVALCVGPGDRPVGVFSRAFVNIFTKCLDKIRGKEYDDHEIVNTFTNSCKETHA